LRAVLEQAYPGKFAAFELVPSKGGCFELTVNGELVYSKLKTGVFPEEGDMVEELERYAKVAA
jgi:selenoprotein W-related protein